MIPGYSLIKKGVKTFKEIKGISTESEGPNIDALYSTLNFLGVLGVRKQYGGKNGKFSREEYLKELEEQGKWYDANLDKVVDLSMKNEFGANDPNLTFEDRQTYMLIHFGKLWDANQYKFVRFEDYQEGGYNDGFDFENDPEAWDKLCEYMKSHGKLYDYNQKRFVHRKDYIYGGLNLSNLDWDTKVALTEEKFGLKWDANQQAFVEPKYYISGGMNDFSQYQGQDFLKHWNELKSLRLALYGEVYDSATHSFNKVQEPTVAVASGFMDNETKKRYSNYYALLAIPRIDALAKDMHINSDGFLVNSKGQYLITGNPNYDVKVFDKFRYTLGGYRGRRYSNFYNYSYNRSGGFKKFVKPYKGRNIYSTPYIGTGWRNYVDVDGYQYRMEYKKRYAYRNRNYRFSLNRLISPPKFYPYGGIYNKFSYQARV